MKEPSSISELEKSFDYNLHYTGIVETSFKIFQDRVLTYDPEIFQDLYFGKLFILKKAYPEDELLELQKKIYGFGQNTPPSFYKITENCPNFHTINDEIPLYKILLRVHSYHFYSWNNYPIDIFTYFKSAIEFYEILCEQDPEEIVRNTAKDDLIIRMQVHHYPVGGGHTQMHSDPTEFVKVAMLVMMSKSGVNFRTGGLFFLDIFGEKFYPEEHLDIGDMVVFYPKLLHGIDPIDAENPFIDWESESGRWTVVFNNRPPVKV